MSLTGQPLKTDLCVRCESGCFSADSTEGRSRARSYLKLVTHTTSAAAHCLGCVHIPTMTLLFICEGPSPQPPGIQETVAASFGWRLGLGAGPTELLGWGAWSRSPALHGGHGQLSSPVSPGAPHGETPHTCQSEVSPRCGESGTLGICE